MLSAKTSGIGCEPNRTGRTGYELNRISRIASEPSRRFLYTAAIEESISTAARPALQKRWRGTHGMSKVQEPGRSF